MLSFKSFFVSPQQNEIIETKIIMEENTKPALIGNVYDENSNPICDAFIAIYKIDKKTHAQIELSGFTYSDIHGNFVLAPLESNNLYNVKIYKNDVKTRILEP